MGLLTRTQKQPQSMKTFIFAAGRRRISVCTMLLIPFFPFGQMNQAEAAY